MPDVRWGIVGTGAIAGQFAAALRRVDGAVLQAVASRSRGIADEFARRFGVHQAYRDYGQLLADPSIDVVYVATRNEYHHDDCIAAIGAGKGVLCEKPFALNAEEGRAIVEAARRRGVFCMEAMWMRCSPAVREVIDRVRGGDVGDVALVSAQFGQRVQFDPLDRVFARPGGGALLDLGVYAVSFVHALLGRPVRISSAVRIGPTGVDEQFTALLDYESGCQAVVAASLVCQLANEAAIHGTSAVISRLGPIYFPSHYHVTPTHTVTRGPAPAATRRRTLPQRLWATVGGVLHRPGVEGELVRRDVPSGYACEAAVVQTCLRSGRLESREMPLDDTIAVLECMDAMSRAWTVSGVEQPGPLATR